MPQIAQTDPLVFDAKASSLIEATLHLSIPQILMARRMTLSDPESLRWASTRQLNTVFDVILVKALERMERIDLLSAMDQNLDPLLPPAAIQQPDDYKVLNRIVTALLNKTRTPTKKLSDWEQAVAQFETLLTRRLPRTPPRHPRHYPPFREPVPLFSVQGGLRATAAARNDDTKAIASAAAAGAAPVQHRDVDFSTLFDDTICAHVRSTLEQLQVPPNYPNPMARPRLPFIVAAEFAPVFEDVLRRFILPQVKESRQVKALSNAYNWPQVGGEQLVEIIQSSEINNPILHNWDMTWNTFKAEPKDGKKPKETPWSLFQEDSLKNNYIAPSRENIRPLLDLIRYEPESLIKCWRELQSLAQQEFSPSGRQERARDGALRDGILKWCDRLPDGVGEFVAIKAAFVLPACTHEYMRALVNNFGRSEQDRRRSVPYLCQFVADMTG